VWSPAVRASAAYRFLTTRMPLHRVIARLLDAFHAFRHHGGALAGALVMTAAGHILLIWFFVVAARVVMAPVPPAGTIAWVGLLALVANVLPVTPGGLGVGEAAFAAAFGLMGFQGGAQLLILMRLGVIPIAIIGALRYMLGHRTGGAEPVSVGASDG
jgi:glycosyltransferase 2 family protein